MCWSTTLVSQNIWKDVKKQRWNDILQFRIQSRCLSDLGKGGPKVHWYIKRKGSSKLTNPSKLAFPGIDESDPAAPVASPDVYRVSKEQINTK